MGKISTVIAAGTILFILLTGCLPSSGVENVVLPTSAGSQPETTTEYLALPTIIENTATSLPPEYPEEPGGMFFDDFSDRNSGWLSGYQDLMEGDYYQGGYKLSVIGDQVYSVSTLSVDYQNVRMVVDARLVGGQTHNDFGLICRASGLDSFYAAVINGDGYYGIYRKVQDQDIELISGDGSEQSVVINQGLTLNLIEMTCMGSTISLRVNGQLLIEVTDTSLQSGAVGLFAGTFSAESTDVLFDNFYLYLEE